MLASSVPSKAVVSVPIGYLRAAITVLVVLHHALLAYHPFAPPPSASLLTEPQLWPAFPVVDAQRTAWAGVIVGFNEPFFMSLMFLLSGLFVWQSIGRKGVKAFLQQRALRLGVPFVVASVLAPLAYYPAYLQTTGRATTSFWHEWTSLGIWYSGPVWFVWVLLVFDCAAAALIAYFPTAAITWRALWARSSRNSLMFFLTVVALSLVAYLPMAATFGSMSWWAFGPFTVQTSRVLHYGLYFFIGVALGDLGRTVTSENGPLAQRWIMWPLTALVAFAVAAALAIAAASTAQSSGIVRAEVMAGLGFVLSCAASSCAALALFLRFARQPHGVANSLRDNAYGVYLVHYAFVSWLQYSLLTSSMLAMGKATVVTVGALVLSWMTAALFRSNRTIRRIV